MSTPEELAQRARAHLFGHILPFWTGPALDPQHGGWVAWMDNAGKIDHSQPQGLVVNCRLLWAFSAAYRLQPDPLFAQMAERAFQYVTHRFWDPQCGGAFWRLNNAGNVIDDSKKIYGQAFFIYAMAENYLAFGRRESRECARQMFELLERHAHDDRHLGYWEVRRRDWGEAESSRLSDKDMDEKKSMNNHLHVLEAYANLLRIWPDTRVKTRLRELIELFLKRILNPERTHFNHFFDEAWQVRSGTYTYGHDIEGSWLLCEAAEVLGDHALLREVEAAALRMAEAVRQEAINARGALCYEGKAGVVIDPAMECWPQAEAVVGFLNAWQLSRDNRYLDAAWGVWRFIEEHLADRQGGDWFWRILPDGSVDPTQPKVSEWKGPYHGTRACLETIRRLTAPADISK